MNKIIAGTMTWGDWGRKFTPQETAALITQCVENGLYTFDHADIYGGYTTEEDFGHGFKESKINRESLIFISKCGIQMPCEKRPLAVKHYNYSKTHIITSVEQSLKNLQTDYLDVLLLHRPSPLIIVDEVAEAFNTLETSGKVKSFGVSNFTPSQIDLLQTEITLDWNQIECSLSHNTPLFDGSLDHHLTQGIKTMAWSPLGSYFKEETPDNERLKPILASLSEKYNASEDQLLYAWLLKHPAGIHPVVGTTRIERLKAAMAAVEINLSREDWFLLLETQWGHEVP